MSDIWCRDLIPESTVRLAEAVWGSLVSPETRCELRVGDHSTGMHRAAGKGGNLAWAVTERTDARA